MSHQTERTGAETLLGRLADEFADRARRGERPDVEEYARAHPDLADILRDVLPVLCGQSAVGPVVLTRLGEYLIVREIGRGGMGVVHEAVQESLGRRVALKVLPPHAVSDPLRLERFRREARAAGHLHHTNIVPVFGVGEHDGVHFYAMQYIPARGLDAALRAIRGREATRDETAVRGDTSLATGEPPAPAPPSVTDPVLDPPLPGPDHEGAEHYRRVARIGVQAADALAYAHAHGIIHRDVKPGNLLLDAAGTLWVTDFGLAKTGDGDLTRSGDVVGTPRYIPPEQFKGEYSPLGDVYSLGLTLYELATLRPAFDAPDWHQLAAQIGQAEPPPPRRVDPRIPRDLETVILRAIAKEPGRRYASAGELADDLRRFLADEPVRARRLGPWGHTVRWCRRNPAVAALTGLAVGLFLAGFGLVSWQWLRADGERDKAVNSLAEATIQKQRAEENFSWAQTAVDELLTEVGEGLDDMPRFTQARRRLLEKAVALHQEFLRTRSDDPAVRFEAARAYRRRGEICQMLGPGRNAEAADSFRAAIDLLEGGPTDPADEPAYRIEKARASARLGDVRSSERKLTEAEGHYRSAIESLGDPPADGEAALFAADTRRFLGIVLERLRRFDEAEQCFRRAVADLTVQHDADPTGDGRRSLLARAHNSLGVFLRGRGRSDAADSYRESITLLRGLVEERPTRRYREELFIGLRNCGNLESARSHLPEAAANYAEAITLCAKLAADFPEVPGYRSHLAALHYSVALVQRRSDEPDRARQSYDDAIATWKGLIERFGPDPAYRIELASTYNSLGNLLHERGDPTGAERMHRDAVGMYEQVAPAQPDNHAVHSGLGLALCNLALRVNQRGDAEEAARLQHRGLPHLRAMHKQYPTNSNYRRYLRTGCQQHAAVLIKLKDYRGAAAVAEEAAELSPELGSEQSKAATLLAECLSLAEADNSPPEVARGYAVSAAKLYCRGGELAAKDATLSAENQRLGYEESGRKAVELLRSAVRHGLDDPAALQGDAFRPLRGRKDFDTLLAELTAKKSGK